MNELLKNAVNECIDGLVANKGSVLSCGSIKDLPSRENVKQIIKTVRDILYPRYFSDGMAESHELTAEKLYKLYNLLFGEIKLAFGYDCSMNKKPCDKEHIDRLSDEIACHFVSSLPTVFEVLSTDINATLYGDPAAHSFDEIILTYPGVEAVFIYRLAHVLYEKGVPLIPRIMSEYAHSKTGIDINPGAKIGKSFVIDHGTGIVIGETTEIGDHVSIYQGVTLGAISLKDSRSLVGKKRHPTICDNVTIYAGATILGGETVIGEGSVIGSSVFITSSVNAGVTVTMEPPKLKLITKN